MTKQELLNGFFLLKGCADEVKRQFFSDPRISLREFAGGEMIQSGAFTPFLGQIVSGTVIVERLCEGKNTVMRTMGQGDVFGVATLFGANEYVTRIRARSCSRIYIYPRELVEELIKSDSTAALNYITFLSEKVRYLNSRIDLYTAGSARERVEGYLRSLCDKNGEAVLPVSLSALAGRLDIGRASLYRAIDALVRDGVIAETEKGYKFTEAAK